MPAPVVLVHGAFHGSWCWDAVIAELATRGVRAIAPELPFNGYDDDRRFLVRVLDSVDRARAVICAHSATGMLISDPALGRVAHLVYVAAFMPEEGEDPVTLIESAPPTDLEMEFGKDGTCSVPPDAARRAFYADLEPAVATTAVNRLRRMSVGSLLAPAASAPLWRSVPSTYVVCERDRAFHPDLQRRLAARAHDTRTLAASHAVMVSHPGLLAQILAHLAT